MIPRIIHYCWFGRGPMPELALKCIESWHKYLPDYEYKLWNEDNFDINSNQFVSEAYEAKKYAFVSDYVRLFAVYNEGGIYMDTDVEVLKSYDNLLHLSGFIGFDGTKHLPVGTGTIACQAKGEWVSRMMLSVSRISSNPAVAYLYRIRMNSITKARGKEAVKKTIPTVYASSVY